jgi:hypothetical protein
MFVLFVFLALLFVSCLFYGCTYTFEKFEGDSEEENQMKRVQEITAKVQGEIQAEKDKEMEETIRQTLKEVNTETSSPAPATSAPGPATQEILNTQEKELFDQITTNKLSGEELDKLIRAGILTEEMVEKFLNQIDLQQETSLQQDKQSIEGFCADDCYAKWA